MAVDYKNELYTKAARSVQTMRDVLAGEEAIKLKGVEYLPKLGAQTDPKYAAFKLAAMFVGYTARTLNGLIGSINRKAPQIELPAQIEYFRDNADGSGIDLRQFAVDCAKEALGVGGYGILEDRPKRAEGSTFEDDIKNGIRSNFSFYPRESIINWKYTITAGASILSMVVLHEIVEVPIDEFQAESKNQWRVLSLDEAGYYNYRVYDDNKQLIEGPEYPTTSNGSKRTRIPFEMKLDKPPLLDMANINLGHYRNSALYEAGLVMYGSPTMVIDPGEMTQDQFDERYKDGVTVGTMQGLIFGKGCKLYLEQMAANGPALEGMQQKEEQMLAIGAKIVQSAAKNQTAEEARINAASEYSILNTVTDNVSESITNLLKAACEDEGANPDQVEFKLNKEFFPEEMTAQDITASIMLVTNKSISMKDHRDKLRRAGILAAERTDDDIEEDIAEQKDIVEPV